MNPGASIMVRLGSSEYPQWVPGEYAGPHHLLRFHWVRASGQVLLVHDQQIKEV